jgi:hypothetical protein
VWLFCHGLKALDEDVMIVTASTYAAISSSIEVCPRRTSDGFVHRLITPMVSVADLCSIYVGMRLTEIPHREYTPDALQLRTLTHSFIVITEFVKCTTVLFVGTLETLFKTLNNELQTIR